MNRKVLAGWAAFVFLIGGGACWYLFSAGSVPAGQAPLGGPQEFLAKFPRDVEKMRIVACLSPSRAEDQRAASALQQLLMEFEMADVAVYVVWQPLAATDWWPPSTGILAQVWDRRVTQYWDKDTSLRSTLGNIQAAVFSRGAGHDSPALQTNAVAADLDKLRHILRGR